VLAARALLAQVVSVVSVVVVSVVASVAALLIQEAWVLVEAVVRDVLRLQNSARLDSSLSLFARG